MMKHVPMHQAKSQLSRLVAEVESGAEIVICRGDTPVALLTRLAPASPQPRAPGLLHGQLGGIEPDAFAPLPPEDAALWEPA